MNFIHVQLQGTVHLRLVVDFPRKVSLTPYCCIAQCWKADWGVTDRLWRLNLIITIEWTVSVAWVLLFIAQWGTLPCQRRSHCKSIESVSLYRFWLSVSTFLSLKRETVARLTLKIGPVHLCAKLLFRAIFCTKKKVAFLQAKTWN